MPVRLRVRTPCLGAVGTFRTQSRDEALETGGAVPHKGSLARALGATRCARPKASPGCHPSCCESRSKEAFSSLSQNGRPKSQQGLVPSRSECFPQASPSQRQILSLKGPAHSPSFVASMSSPGWWMTQSSRGQERSKQIALTHRSSSPPGLVIFQHPLASLPPKGDHPIHSIHTTQPLLEDV